MGMAAAGTVPGDASTSLAELARGEELAARDLAAGHGDVRTITDLLVDQVSTTHGVVGLDTVLDTGCSIPSWPCLAVRNANELTTRWLVAGELGELVPSNQLWRCSGPAQPSAARVVGRISTRQHSPELLTLIGRNELWNAMHGPPNLLSCCH